MTGILLRPATVVAALVLVVGVAAVIRFTGDEPTVAMVSADGTTVSIPGGSGLEAGRAGLDLPDGSRIEVAAGSEAVVAGVVLEGGSSAVVVDGRIELVEAPALTSTAVPTTVAPPTTAATTTIAPPSTPTTRRVPGPTVTTAIPTESTAPPPTDSVEPPITTIPATTIPPTTVPPATDAPPSTPAPTTSVPVTAAPTTIAPTLAPATSSPSTTKPVDEAPVDPVVLLTVGAVSDGKATLTWTVDGPTESIAFWEVRLVQPDSTKTVAVIRLAEARRLRVEVPDTRAGFRVVARSGGDGVVARSTLVSPGG